MSLYLYFMIKLYESLFDYIIYLNYHVIYKIIRVIIKIVSNFLMRNLFLAGTGLVNFLGILKDQTKQPNIEKNHET